MNSSLLNRAGNPVSLKSENEKSGIDANGAKDRQPNPVEMTREVIDRNFLVSARPKLGYFDRSGKSSQCIPGIFKAQDFPR
uniref:Uncharacterized protein n=1 Tax=Candidatus Kentrum sp. SD TaxID=2126332 RepID=A0A450YL69_9GAMM|nr:MAG: hypothetical protein BECKSD772F_GA0070984_11185 [Candidatus Kentron sp. SD]VFK48171.1 MAG: hypothetical protein BECKSD772E_GA0070983_111512 [Candidatus Kentron sp. SD]VFK77684.1 MAG: hypothetical protein BECKSD772D_GA0070982_100113 [Candidatus Kentron sp. SD]